MPAKFSTPGWTVERREQVRRRATTHGLSYHPLYVSWREMIRRCEDPRATGFSYYGGRGIRVCDEWHDVAAFIGWIEANLGQRPDGMTLDRTDNDGHYEPGNVRWATKLEQAANRRPRTRWTDPRWWAAFERYAELRASTRAKTELT